MPGIVGSVISTQSPIGLVTLSNGSIQEVAPCSGDGVIISSERAPAVCQSEMRIPVRSCHSSTILPLTTLRTKWESWPSVRIDGELLEGRIRTFPVVS